MNTYKKIFFLCGLFFLIFMFTNTIPVFAKEKTTTIKIREDDIYTVPNSNNGGLNDEVHLLSSYNTRYGNQLSGDAKAIYNMLVSHFYTKKKTTGFEPTKNISVSFKATLINGYLNRYSKEYENAYDKILKSYTYARDAFLADYPEVFWLYNVAYSMDIEIKKASSGYKGTITVAYIYPYTDDVTQDKYQGEFFPGASKLISNYEKGVNNAVSQIKKSINNSTNPVTIYKAINQYLCNRVDYDVIASMYLYDNSYNYASTSANAFISSPYGSTSRLMICGGYAKSFKVLCDAFGLRSSCVTVVGSTDSGNHEWNYVRVYDKWYLVDVTWNDTGANNLYLLLGSNDKGMNDKKVNAERTAFNYFNDWDVKFTLPKLSTTSYEVDIKNRKTGSLAFKNSSITKTYTPSAFTYQVSTKNTNGKITYSSSNKNIATVDNTGKVTLKKVGKCTITASSSATTAYTSSKASYNLVVTISNAKLAFKQTSVTKKLKDKTFKNSFKTKKTDGKITYKSSNKKIATVDKNGKVKLLKAGKVTITATAAASKNYKKTSASFKLTIKK